jgi:DNA-binding CsgD family transcriptional regulator
MPDQSPRPIELQLLERIYDAALDPELWPEFIQALAQALQATVGLLSIHDLVRGRLLMAWGHGLPERRLEEAAQGMARWRPLLERVAESDPVVFRAEEMLAELGLRGAEAGAEPHDPLEGHWHADAVVLRDPGRVGLLDLRRSRAGGRFADAELEMLTQLQPHVRRALLINQKFWNLLAQPNAALAVLEHLEIGVLFINAHDRPVYLNQKARQMTRFGDGVIVGADGLSAGYEQQAAALRELVHEAVQTGLGHGLHAGGIVRVGMREDSPYFVLVSPLRSERFDLGVAGERICAAVFISSPHHPYAVSVETLRAMYGLTPAESHVVGEMANGLSLEQIATKQDVSKHTVRDHLKSVFAKTGLRRQVELITLIRATPTTTVNEAILLGTPLAGPLDHRRIEHRRKGLRVPAPAAG